MPLEMTGTFLLAADFVPDSMALESTGMTMIPLAPWSTIPRMNVSCLATSALGLAGGSMSMPAALASARMAFVWATWNGSVSHIITNPALPPPSVAPDVDLAQPASGSTASTATAAAARSRHNMFLGMSPPATVPVAFL